MVKTWLMGITTGVVGVLAGGIVVYHFKHRSREVVHKAPSGRVISQEVYDELNNILLEHENRALKD